MNVAFLLKQYFENRQDVSIDVFDAHTLNNVYQNVLKTLTSHFEIEVSVLQALSYCFYEILDNVHIHSGRPIGTAMTHFDSDKDVLRVLIADDGVGIRESLAGNEKFRNVGEGEALQLCLQDSVTDGKGMGFGLYATSRLMKDVGLQFIIHSGNHKLISKNGETRVMENGFWQGTIVYMELATSKEIDPSEVVDHRTDAETEYNECFIETDGLDSLWNGPTSDVTLGFSKYGTDFGTRDMGAKIREELLSLIRQGLHVALDFSGVNVVSNSFADECIAKLLLEIPLDEMKRLITFRDLTPMAERSILVAIQRRYKCSSTAKSASSTTPASRMCR
ncbi:MAG: STAS-like domain-containing protein [Bacteroidales bacterium]|nr:STAS-like domain-containing protein [Bacteroidales bacterium]